MAIDEQTVQSVASRVVADAEANHAEHGDATVQTVGVIVAVQYQDPDSGDTRTRTHYRFVHGPDFEECPLYVALGLTTQVVNDMT